MRRIFPILGLGLLLGLGLWKYAWALVDGFDHLMTILGWAEPNLNPQQGFHAYLAAHPHPMSENIAYVVFFTCVVLIAWPVLMALADRYFASRDINEAHGWSVSITVPDGLTGLVTADEYSCLMFQQFRFANVSTVRPRMLDVTISSKWHPDGRSRVLLRTDQGHQLTAYHKAIGGGAKSDRMVNCIEFPLRLQPFDVVEGQIVTPLPNELKEIKPAHEGLIKISRDLRFVFRDQLSGREIRLRNGDFYDATKGHAVTTIQYPSKWALLRNHLRRWWQA